jgi:hypothetical protein
VVSRTGARSIVTFAVAKPERPDIRRDRHNNQRIFHLADRDGYGEKAPSIEAPTQMEQQRRGDLANEHGEVLSREQRDHDDHNRHEPTSTTMQIGRSSFDVWTLLSAKLCTDLLNRGPSAARTIPALSPPSVIAACAGFEDGSRAKTGRLNAACALRPLKNTCVMFGYLAKNAGVVSDLLHD